MTFWTLEGARSNTLIKLDQARNKAEILELDFGARLDLCAIQHSVQLMDTKEWDVYIHVTNEKLAVSSLVSSIQTYII